MIESQDQPGIQPFTKGILTLQMRIEKLTSFRVLVASLALALIVFATAEGHAQQLAPSPDALSTGWELQDAAKVPEAGAQVSSLKFKTKSWYAAVVPGTVLTTLVKAGIYPEPLYGENNRPDRIPETLNKTSYWYRTVAEVPSAYKERHTWLNFEGINYSAVVWVNGTQVGTMRGAFKRGIFDISNIAKPVEKVVIAVLVTPQPHPGDPHEHTIENGMVLNGGVSAVDGP